ncbi:hypothetical protein [uncultured Sulfitobacter sp.]|uniref:hypothetical protein n=1 Tax=uncultured Sulfitobacter sp. TaxID=191468 RepID=UPI0025949ED6|nr:hypothetical protein [uncultured Sulfitobacter sp.]
MITTIATWLIGKGVKEKFAKPLIYVVGAGLLISVLGIGKCSYDASVIREHDAKVNLESETNAREADGEAAGQRREDDARTTSEGAELEEVRENDPDKDEAATDSQRDYLRCVRLQQQRREANQPAPTCRRPASNGVE